MDLTIDNFNLDKYYKEMSKYILLLRYFVVLNLTDSENAINTYNRYQDRFVNNMKTKDV